MQSFDSLDLNKFLRNAVTDLGYNHLTEIQEAAYSVIRSGKDVVGISQTGTGKTFAYLLPLLNDLKYSNQLHPRILILVPTRELVAQVVEQIEILSKYINLRVIGVFGEANIRTQQADLAQGQDIVVATPGRLYDLIINRGLQPRDINKVVIDEVDVMLDLGFRTQLNNIFELLPGRRQHIMFSATMTEEVEVLIDDYFAEPEKISIAVSGTPLDNIDQACYPVKNFNTKTKLVSHLLRDKDEYKKVLIFIASKKLADRLFNDLEMEFGSDITIIHSNKSQNYRLRSVDEFESGERRILLATDVIARGIDFEQVTHVINFDVPLYPENYMHRIGRTGRAKEKGSAILLFTESEEGYKVQIESLMRQKISQIDFPDDVEIVNALIPEEKPAVAHSNFNRKTKVKPRVIENEQKKEKNQKINLGGSYKRKLNSKYKKPKTRGDKNQKKRR